MKVLGLLLISGILAAGVFITGKQAGNEQLAPPLVLFWQMCGGGLVVLAVAWPSRRFPTWDLAHLRYYLVGGLLGISLPYLLAFIVLRELQVGTVGLLTALSPLVTYGLARIMGLEAGHPLRLLGLIVGLAGVSLLVAPDESAGPSAHWLYLLLALAIPVTLGASNIYRSRFWPKGAEAMPLALGMLTVQAVGLALVNLSSANVKQLLTDSWNAAPLLLVLGLLAGFSYLASFTLLKKGGPVYLSQMGYVITAVTLAAGILLWGEHYGSGDLLSMGLILSGLLLTTVTQRLHTV